MTPTAALAHFNAGVQRARDAYDRDHCPRCGGPSACSWGRWPDVCDDCKGEKK